MATTTDTRAALKRLELATRRRAQVQADLERADEAWRRALLGAVDEGATVVDAVRAGGVSRRRFYQVAAESRPGLPAVG